VLTGIVFSAAVLPSCDKFVAIDKAPNQLQAADVYTSDGTATSAVLALYSNYYTASDIGYFSFLGGVESDELNYAQATDATLTEFQQAVVSITNSSLSSYLWVYPYGWIGEANLAINGLNSSTVLTPSVKSQLLGESKFFRAFVYFYLVNYFGGVPLALSGNAFQDAYLPRASADSVYAQIVSDLKDAENLLPDTYVGSLRARVNKYAVSALLARVYLYTKDYPDAGAEASKVIGASDVTYNLPALDSAFVNTSNEVIFQIASTYGYAVYGSNYRGSSATALPVYTLAPTFVQSFEAGDRRRAAWVDSMVSNSITYYRINKDVLYTATAGNEYNVVLRLAEQYLIRAEARAQQDDISGAQADLNAVRSRAGLGATTAATQADLLTAILNERKVELFGEWSHRWFDLKRTGEANAVIGALKPATWKSTAVLEPIPYTEILENANLTQNTGY
jgi:hypothetical protein